MEIGTYTKIEYQNGGGPPINAENLNKMDDHIYELDHYQGVQDDALQAHEDREDNPHNVTPEQLGLHTIIQDLQDHEDREDNPHSVTAEQVGLGTIVQDLQDHEDREDNPHNVTAEQLRLPNPETQVRFRVLSGRQHLQHREVFDVLEPNYATENATVGVVLPTDDRDFFVLLGPTYQTAHPDEVHILYTGSGHDWHAAYTVEAKYGVFNTRRWTDACVGGDNYIHAISGYTYDVEDDEWVNGANECAKIDYNIVMSGTEGVFEIEIQNIYETPQSAVWTSIAYSPSLDTYVIAGLDRVGYRIGSSVESPWTTMLIDNRNSSTSNAIVQWIERYGMFVCAVGRTVYTSSDGQEWDEHFILPSGFDVADMTWSGERDEHVIVPKTAGATTIWVSNGMGNYVERFIGTDKADRQWKSIIWVPEYSMYVGSRVGNPHPVLATSPDGNRWRVLGENVPLEQYSNKLYWSPHLDSLFLTLDSDSNDYLPVIRMSNTIGGDTW